MIRIKSARLLYHLLLMFAKHSLMHQHDAVSRPLGLTGPNNKCQPGALDFVKPGHLTNLLCKGTFPPEGESTCLLSDYFRPPLGSLQYRRNRDFPKVSYA
ncbi:hypothetical protein P5V15_008136 [Pogonomyrmex californicus]